MNRCNIRTVKRLNAIIHAKKYKEPTGRSNDCRAWIAKINSRWMIGGPTLPNTLNQ